jgi:protocatechuate 3,4-dioxygenase beta subunit
MNLCFLLRPAVLTLLGAVLLGSPASASGRGAISGLVRDTSGNLLSGTTVQLSLAGRSEKMTTTSSGVYRFAELPPGSGYRLTASARRMQTARLSDLKVVAEATSQADFALLPSRQAPRGTLTGVVVAPAGTRVSGARVEVLTGASDGRTTTDRRGGFRLRGLAPGAYAVSVSSDAHATAILDTVLVGTGTTAIRIQLDHPDELPGTLFGTVRDQNGHLLSGARVEIIAGPSAGAVQVDEHGHYELAELSAGTYTLRAAAEGFQDQTWEGILVSEGHGTRVDFALHAGETVPRASSVSGTVTGSGGSPLHGAVVEITAGPSSGHSAVNAHGGYSLPDLQPGNYTVQASLAGFITQAAEVAVTEGSARTQNFTLTAAPALGQVRGVVTDALGHLLAGVRVEIVEGPATGRHTLSNAHGQYHLGDLAAGTYRLRFSSHGFETLDAPELVIGSGQTVVQDAVLVASGSGHAARRPLPVRESPRRGIRR